jgi:hypothetical protein
MTMRAYIGLAGPIGYDYRNEAPRVNDVDSSSPNPVLENVLGLILCYDEIYFLAPQFCPADMRNLPYVHFIADDPALSISALQALEDFDASNHEEWVKDPSFDRFAQISEAMRGEHNREQYAIDNHTHGIHLGNDRVVTGNAMNLDNAARDLWVAAELDLSSTDVIFSSPAQEALNEELEKEVAEGHYFGPLKREAAQRLAILRVRNFLGPKGSYHESLEELRARRDVEEFRQYLIEVDADAGDGIALADSISRQAFDYVDQQLERYLRDKHWFQSFGIPTVRGVLNAIHHPLGSAAAVALQAPLQLGERRFKKKSRWAPFVVDLYGPGKRPD